MRTSIALLPALVVAAALRPAAEVPAVPRLAPAVDRIELPSPPIEDSPRPSLTEALAGALLPSKVDEPERVEGHLPALESARLSRPEDPWLDLNEAWRRGLWTRAHLAACRLLQQDPENLGLRRLINQISLERRARVEAFRHAHHTRLDPETLRDLFQEEWTVVAESLLDCRLVSLDVECALMVDVLQKLRDETGLPLILDARISGPLRPDPLVTLKVSNIPLRQAIRFVLDQGEPRLDIEVLQEEKVVLLRHR